MARLNISSSRDRGAAHLPEAGLTSTEQASSCVG
jgi:hypothetical protein